jgi:hypothetical protein
MSRSDAEIRVMCDTCQTEEVWEPEFVYRDFSGANGYYDTSNGAFRRWCESAGWKTDDDTDTCADCLEGSAE